MNNLQLIEQVLYYIDEHISEPITFEHLAEKFGYSAFHFHRIFSTVTEQTITDYMKKRRLTLAHMQLCETEKTVTEIAFSKGFNSIQSFNRTFKETFGMTPLEARKRKPKITYRSVETIVTGYMKRVYMEGEFSLTPHFEYYDERWDCQSGAAQMELYIPVRRLED